MANSYDDARYGVIERKWFGATIKHGGDSSAPITFNETGANKVTRWYPKGPVQILKFGCKTVGTLGKGEQFFTAKIDGSTVMKKIVASTTSAPYTIASEVVDDGLAAGSYLSILASSNVCSTGSVALFIDFRRKFGTGHHPTS